MAKSAAAGRAAKSATAPVKSTRGRPKKASGAKSAAARSKASDDAAFDDDYAPDTHVPGALAGSETPASHTPEPEISRLAEAAEVRDAVEQRDQSTQASRRHDLDPAKMFFDAVWYRDAYEDVRLSGVDPVQHYMTFGYLEGRNPNAAFSTLGYMAANPDLANAGINAFLHYILHGAAEGRSTEP